MGEPDINPGGASGENLEQGSSAGNENLLAGCVAAVNKLVCDTPTVDLKRDRTTLSGKFPEDELKAGRERLLGTPDTFFIKYFVAKEASCKDFGILVIDISVAFMHARIDEEMYVKVPSHVKSSKC